MSNEESKFPNGFQGIVITGWSRYDHFAVLAELLPASMPSLATNLISVSHGYFNASWQKELYQSLQCADNSRLYEEFIDLESDPTLHEKMSWCFFIVLRYSAFHAAVFHNFVFAHSHIA